MFVAIRQSTSFAQGQSCLSQGRLLDFPFRRLAASEAGNAFCFLIISLHFMIFAVIASFFEAIGVFPHEPMLAVTEYSPFMMSRRR